MSLDYSKLTDEQLQAIADKDYSKLPDDVLTHLADEHDAAQNPEAAPVNLSPDVLASRNDPLNTAGIGAIVGTTALGAKKGIDVVQALNNLNKGQPAPAAPPAPETYVSPGQKWSSKTGFGAGEGETVHEVDKEFKRIEAEKNKPAGRGKIASRITGGTPDEILARAKQEEAELAKQARIRAQDKLALEAKNKLAAAAAMEQKLAHEAEQRFRVPNTVGKMLPVAGATAGYNVQDVINQDNPVQKGIAAVGAAGSAAPFIKKLPPKLRAIGVGASLLAPVINRGIDAVQDHAAGGSIQHLAVGGLDKLAKKGLEFAGKALKPLERAPAKTRAEIRAIAERMAPQELGQFVQAPGKTNSVAGLSKSRYDREQGLIHDIRNEVSTKSLPEMDCHNNIGDVSMMLPGDKSTVADIHSFAGIPLEKMVRSEGGVPYPIHEATKQLPPEEAPRLWTSTGQVAKNYMNLGKKVAQESGAENVLPIYANMPQGMGYSQHFADLMLRGLRPAGADLGKATDMMRTGSFKGKTFPDFPGFEDTNKVYELFKHDPEMRQLFTNRLQIQDVAKSLGLPPTYGTDALHAISVPELRNLETGAGGQMVGKLNFHSPMTLSEHNGYIPDRDIGLHIPGEAIARNKYATPYEMQYPDLLQDIRNNPITYESKTGKPMIVPEFGRLKMDSPRQIIDPQHADEMAMYNEEMKKLIGRSEGGVVPSYGTGGKILELAKDFVLPAAENAARTQIIGTLPTYAKAAEALAKHGATGKAIDFGAGLGEGAKALGKNVDTYEPFAKNWNPTFTKPEDIPTDAYNRLTNLNVLNVVPREARDEIAQHIGRVMEPGGLGVLTTRGADVMKAQGSPGPEPMSVITSRDTYQKGFTKQELEDYMRYMLGNKFEVNKFNLGPAGVMIKKK